MDISTQMATFVVVIGNLDTGHMMYKCHYKGGAVVSTPPLAVATARHRLGMDCTSRRIFALGILCHSSCKALASCASVRDGC